MNICVLIKPVADPASIRWDYREQRFDFMTPGFNPPDLHALQWACDYKQTHAARIAIVTVVDADQEVQVEPLLKYAVDECMIIKCANLSAYRHETGLPLAKALKDQAFDLILCGSQSEDTHSGVTPAVLAELLGISYVSGVHQIDPASDHIWQVKRKSGRDRVQTFQIELPAVIGVTGSIARRRYVSRYSAGSNRQKAPVRFMEVRLEKEPEIEVLRVTEPRPNIRYFTVPSSALTAEKRLQEMMGFNRGARAETAGKIAPHVSEPAIQYIKEKLLLWLKGD